MEERFEGTGGVPSRSKGFLFSALSRPGDAVGSRPCQNRRGELAVLLLNGEESNGEESPLKTEP